MDEVEVDTPKTSNVTEEIQEIKDELETTAALSNVLVVQNIIKYLSLSDIVNLRAVCKILDEYSSPVVERRIDEFRISISSPSDLQRYLDTETEDSLKFTNFVFNEVPFSHPIVEKFFKNPRNEITYFALRCPISEETVESITPEQFYDLLVNKLPNLKKLEIISLSEYVRTSPFGGDTSPTQNAVKLGITSLAFHIHKSHEYTPDFLQSFHAATPFAHEFFLKVRMDNSASFERGMALSLFKNFVQRPDAPVVNSLEMRQLDPLVWFMIMQLFGPVKFRSLKAHTFDFGANYLISSGFFLDQHKDSLEILELESSDETIFTLGFPSMPKLKSLSILSTRGCASIEELDWGLRFDKLTTLRISCNVANSVAPPMTIFPMSSSPCPRVTELELPELLDREHELNNIARIFPNLKKLAVSVSVHALGLLKTLWEVWPGLEVLALAFNLNPVNSGYTTGRELDSVFTGIPLQNCCDLYTSNLLNLIQTEVVDQANKISSGVSDLTGLKYLFLRAGSGVNLEANNASKNCKYKLSNVTALISFLNMENLQGLAVDFRLHEISPGCIDFICNRTGLMDVSDRDSKASGTMNLHLVRYDWQTKFKLGSNGVDSYPSPCIGWEAL